MNFGKVIPYWTTPFEFHTPLPPEDLRNILTLGECEFGT